MSDRPEIVEIAGWRREDAQAIHALHNEICAKIGRAGIPEVVVLRRLRLLSSWIQASANTAFNADPVAEGLEDADRFWSRRATGERGEDGR